MSAGAAGGERHHKPLVHEKVDTRIRQAVHDGHAVAFPQRLRAKHGRVAREKAPISSAATRWRPQHAPANPPHERRALRPRAHWASDRQTSQARCPCSAPAAGGAKRGRGRTRVSNAGRGSEKQTSRALEAARECEPRARRHATARRTWYNMVSRASGAVIVLLMQPAIPPASITRSVLSSAAAPASAASAERVQASRQGLRSARATHKATPRRDEGGASRHEALATKWART